MYGLLASEVVGVSDDTADTVYVLLGHVSYRDTDIQGIYTTRKLAESAQAALESEHHHYDTIHIQEEELRDEIVESTGADQGEP